MAQPRACGFHAYRAMPPPGTTAANLAPASPGPEAEVERLRAQLDAVSRIQMLGARFVHGERLEGLLHQVVDTAMAIVGSDFGNIQLLDPRTQRLRIVAQRGFPPWWLAFWANAAADAGACGRAFRQARQVVVEDVEHSELFAGTPALDIQRRAGVRALQSTPLIARNGALLGMFSTHYRRVHRPDEDTLRLLRFLAREVADLVEASQLRDRLTEREARYRAAVETSIDGFVMVAHDGAILDANLAYAHATGWSRDELLRMHIWDLEADETLEQVRSHIGEVHRKGSDTFVTRQRRRDGSIWPVEVRAVHWPQADGNIFAVMRDMSERLEVERRIIDAATAEQERIGREIHDGIGQGLTAVSLMVEGLRRRLPDPQCSGLDKVAEQLERLHREARLLAHGLSPLEIGPDGLVDALRQLVETTRAASRLPCTLRVHGTPARLDPVVALHLYRIAQEAIANALQHAHASSIQVSLDSTGAQLALEISDDGVGFGENAPSGAGVSILGYRARSIGARLAIETRGRGGSVVRCLLAQPA